MHCVTLNFHSAKFIDNDSNEEMAQTWSLMHSHLPCKSLDMCMMKQTMKKWISCSGSYAYLNNSLVPNSSGYKV